MDEPIAIIGLDARLPGDGDTAEHFYESLLAGRSARTEVPPERYNVEAFCHPDAERSGATRARFGHYLNGSVATFDAPFFSITPAEASNMDPQQRGMLESVYKALENAGIPLPVAAGSQTGVYVGCFSSDYHDITIKDLDIPSKYAATGTVASMLSNRVSWFFDFRGPSVTIDTACSSSLVAAHEACMSLKLREISMAVVGGCNLILTPEMTLNLDAAGVLGPDGKSYSFDHRGNGYARGEGFGVLVLKRVSDAIRDGDVIRAVIRNSSSNSDGRSPGITQPTKRAQAALIKHVYTKAGLDPSVTRFFEAHGTGTAVGDPIEASAIAEVFASHRSPEDPLFVGALKSNVGHLEGAAGVAGLIKGVFTLESGVIPPNIWFEKRNPKIEESWNLKFPTTPTAWPQSGVRRMSINSFGVGGSNAHVVMDDALHFLQGHRLVGNHRTEASPRREKLLTPLSLNGNSVTNGTSEANGTNGTNGSHAPNGLNGASTNGNAATHAYTNGAITNGVNGHHHSENGHTSGHSNGHSNGHANGHVNGNGLGTNVTIPDDTTLRLFVLSSFDQDGVTRSRDNYLKYLDSKVAISDSQLLSDLSYTLGSKRTHHSWRSFALGDSKSSLRNALTQLPKPGRVRSEPQLAFVFTGQGAQWPAMGMELMAFLAFQESLLAADKYLNELGSPWSLTYELSKGVGNSQVDDPEFSQPLCTALQVALVDLLATWNIFPRAITGHSSGEVAAAYAAGAISREAAWKVSYYRGKLSAKLSRATSTPTTGMAAVGLNLEETRAIIDRVNSLGGEGTLEIACYNSWNSYTISGGIRKIETLVDTLTQEKKFARKLNVQLAYHSQYMKAISEEYLKAMGTLEHGTTKGANSLPTSFFSSTVGMLVPRQRLQDPAYWVENLVSPVRFCDSVTALVKGPPKANGHRESGIPPVITDILEIGPHSALKGPLANITKTAGKTDIQYHSVILRKRSAVETALEAAGSLFSNGFDVDLAAINRADGSSTRPLMLTDLPGYAFNHSKEYWVEGKPSRDFRLRPFGRHELLGAPVPDWNRDNAIWRNYIRLSENPWIEDHKVAGEILYPAAGMLVMAVEASLQLADKDRELKGFRFRDVSFHAALRVPDDAMGVESHFYLRPHRETSLPIKSAWSEFQVCTFQDGEWREHCRGLVQTEYQSAGASLEDQFVREDSDRAIGDAQSICTKRVESDKLYRSFKDSGLDFGPTFQTLNDVRLGSESQVLGRLDSSVPKIKNLMPHQYLMPHLIHPATLDGVVHANLAALVLDTKGTQQPRVPVYAGELWIAANAQTAHDAYLVTAQPKAYGRQDAESTVTAVHATTGQPMVLASGLVFKTLPSSAEAESTVQRNSYNIEWKPDPTFLSEEQASAVFRLPMTPEEDPSAWMTDCEALCLAYIRRFLDSVSNDDRRVNSMDWHHKRYFSWFQHVANSLPSDSSTPSDQEIAALEQKVADRGTPEGVLITAVGRALPDMLGGPLDPLEVVFKDKTAENVYRDGLGAKRCYTQLCAYVDALAHANPSLQILEIGAGTGGATRPVVETLTRDGRRYAHYEFTDISPSFFEQARETFAEELGHMNFRVLNVENDPSEQGFEAEKYDVVLAANVLHATKNIDVSLAHARKLLKPGGKILLFEITNLAILLSSFCFGVLPGWWLSEDKDRIWGPLMSVDGWRSHLTTSGFTGLDGVFSDFPGSPGQMTSILVSNVPKLAQATETETTYILADAASPLQKDVAERLSTVLGQNTSVQVMPFSEVNDKQLTNATTIALSELEGSILEDVPEETFKALQKIVTESKVLFWLTRGGSSSSPAPDLELVTGLARAVRLERLEDFKFATVSFEQDATVELIVEKALQTLTASRQGLENSFRVANGLVHVPRIVKAGYVTEHIRAQTAVLEPEQKPFGENSGRHLAIRLETLGQLDTLAFDDDPLAETALADDEVEFEIKATALGHRDLLAALGRVDESTLGWEAAGIITKVGAASKFQVGDQVFGLALSGTIKTVARTQDGFLSRVPESMSFIEAASLPLAYTTANAVLGEPGATKKGDTVLIHGATSTVGQAAIQLAQLKGAEVFVTAESEEKRAFLESTYGIPHDHVFSSDDRSFKLGIRRITGNRGVNLVLDDLSGDARNATTDDTLDVVARFGRLVQLGSTTNFNASFASHSFARGIRLETFDIAARAIYDPVQTQANFQRAADVLASSEFKRREIPTTSYSFSQIQDALHQVQTGNGNIVLEAHAEDIVPMVPTRKVSIQFDSDASYVIAGGLGGLGRSIARWMVARGAKNLILLSRSGPTTSAAQGLIEELKGANVKVAVPTCDVTDSEALKSAIATSLTSMPPIKGCIQGSMVLKDNRLEDMSVHEWNAAVRSKVNTSWNLHSVLGSGLDFFILLSSTVGITGNPEQSNYAAGGTFQDALARHLTAQGVNAVSLDLPVILGVGFVAEKPELLDYMRSTGWAYMEEKEFHAALDYHCRPRGDESVPLARSQVIPRFWLPQDTAAEGYTLPNWRHDPLFSHLTQTQKVASGDSKAAATKEVNHAALLAAATSMEEAEKAVLEAVLLKLSRVLSVDVSNLDPAKPLHSYGVDSLVAVDLRSWLAKQLGADVSVFDMTSQGSILQLISTVTARSKLTPSFGK